MFEAIEKLKQEYTDKHVVVVGDRPELARFAGVTGQVKTVNMNRRALVQFDAWNNAGWYDIALDFLQVVPTPESAAEHAGAPVAAETIAPSPAGRVSPASQRSQKRAAAPAAEAPTSESPVADQSRHEPTDAQSAAGGEIPTVTHESGPEAPTVD